jgi:hypothetical protein
MVWSGGPCGGVVALVFFSMLPDKVLGDNLVISHDDVTSKNVLTGYSLILYDITI